MTEKQETIQQENEQIDKSTDDIQLNETITNETQRELWIAQVQIETQNETIKLQQDISKETFSNYMKELWTPIESQSKEIQEITEKILWPSEELELTKEQKKYNEIKTELNDAIKNKDIKKIKSSVKDLIKTFLWKFKRKINIWNNISYEADKNDKNYIINAINTTSDSEKRSELTYLLGKIIDEETKEKLTEKWLENPSQFQLFLQNCKPWQLILTNGESKWSKWHETFSKATQIVSWSRWCHAAVISNVKEENWIIVDATLVQATWTWIGEVSLKEYFQKEYKDWDLLLWSFLPPEKGDEIVNHCKSYIWNKYSQKNLIADTIFNNLDDKKIKKQDKNKYCSELVFTWMQESWLTLPEPHTTPADLLSTPDIKPEYCCYCDNFA